MAKFLPHLMNSVLVEAWDAFKVSSRNIISDSFTITKLTPLISPDLTTNTQECAASVQVYSESRAVEINNISRNTVAHIAVQVTRTDDPMFFL